MNSRAAAAPFRLPAARALALSAFCLLPSAFCLPSARAANYIWKGGGPNNNWTTGTNWFGNAAPPSDLANTDLFFGASAAVFPSINTAYSIHSLTWISGASGYNFDTGPLTLGAGGFIQGAANAQGFSANVRLGANQTWTLADGAGALSFGGGLGIAGFGLTVNAATTAGDGNVIAGNITGVGSLTKTGAGVLTLTGTGSTYSGFTDVTAGTLAFSNAGALGATSAVYVSGGGELRATGDATLNRPFVVLANTAGTVSAAPGATLTLTNLTLQGDLAFGTAGQTGVVTLNGTQAATSSAATITVNAGTLRNGSNVLGLSYYAINAASTTVNAGATVDLNGISTVVKNLQGAGSVTTGGTEATVLTVRGGTFAGAITGPGGLTKDSMAALTLTGANTYTGPTNVNAGTLAVAGNGALTNTAVTVNAGGNFTVGGSANVNLSTTKALTVDGTAATPATATLSGGTLAAGATYVGSAANGVGAFTQSGGTHDLGAGALVLGYVDATSQGTYTQSGGTLTAGDSFVGLNGTGTFNQSGGSHTVSNTFALGRNPGGNGTYNLSGTGTLSTVSSLVGAIGVGTFNQSGGTHTVTSGGQLLLAFNAGTVGTYNLSGGTLSTFGTDVGDSGTGTFNQNGGTHAINGSLDLGFFADGRGTYNLNGGTLATNSVTGNAGAGTFNFNGGTLRPNVSTTALLTGANLTANVGVGGARVDTNGRDVTIGVPLAHDPALPAGTVDGGLLKDGRGTLTLSGVNTFTGPVTINAGVLAVAAESALGAPAGGVTNVNGGGQLRFTGSATLARTYNLGISTLAAVSGSTLTLNGASLNGGFLAGPGSFALTGGTTLNGVTTLANSTLTQAPGLASFLNATTIRGALTQTGGALNLTNGLLLGSGRLTVNGTINAAGTELQGVTSINSGGALANSGGSLYLTGGSRTTVAPGGTLSTANGTTVELNGSLLVNNGTQTGALNVNFGSLAKGGGAFGTVNVSDGGRFSPGNSPGTATLLDATFGAGSRYDFELNRASYNTGDGHGDFLNVLDTLSLTAGTTANSAFTVALMTLNDANAPAALPDFDASQPYTFTLATAVNGITGFSAAEIAVDASGFLNATGGGSFAVALSPDGHSLLLQFNPVPEPGTWALLTAGGLGLLGAGRFNAHRRRRSSAA